MIRCAILGAKGYTGSELIRILLKHPNVTITFLGSRDSEEISVSEIIPQIVAPSNLCVERINEEKIVQVADVIFLALPHTTSMEFVEKFVGKGKVIIDLSADYRFKDQRTYEKWYKTPHTSAQLLNTAVYGLPELNTAKIKKAEIIANPGCYPTAVSLGLLPLVSGGLIDPTSIIVDAKSGASGAGRKLSLHTQFCELHENFYAYKVNQHQHTPEMIEVLSSVNSSIQTLTFVPHLLPLMRGILATAYINLKKPLSGTAVHECYTSFYKNAPFVRVKPQGFFPQLKDVTCTNFCDIGIHVDESKQRVIVISAIDNLVKGASGQAVHNMNIRFGFDETAGLV
jgi:N-acetyl-gamma-glutamyl-phosphate reductase